MNVLITGVNGFVGTNLLQLLKDKFCLYGLDIVEKYDFIIQTFSWLDIETTSFTFQNLHQFDEIIHIA